ncbi:MAG: hypothetical protein FJ198_02620, partial [Gammaproteobacteria bacterium]|nr:hypothetical protein [Gammaproteobacteria bacterium]
MKTPSNSRCSARLVFSVIATWLAIGSAVAAPATVAPEAKAGDWIAFGRDPGGSQHSPLAQIDTGNVRKLRRVWTHRSGDFIDAPSPKGSILQVTPLHVNGTLYFCTPFNRVFALDAETGRERWVFDPHRPDPQTGREALSPPRTMASRCRGVAYWESTSTADSLTADPKKSAGETPCRRRIFKNGENARVYALDADTGALCADFGSAKGHPGWAS